MSLCARSIFYMKTLHVGNIVCSYSTSHIYFYPALVFIQYFIWSSFINDSYLYVYVCVSFVCIFSSETGHHGKKVFLNGMHKYI